MQIRPDEMRKTRPVNNRLNHEQVNRDILSDEEMDRRINALLSKHRVLGTHQLMMLVGSKPTHTEVRKSLARLNAIKVGWSNWSLPGPAA